MSFDLSPHVEMEITHLNVAWLYALREAARENIEAAMTRFGVSREIAEMMTEASPADIREMADPAILSFRPRGSNTTFRDYLRGNVAARARFLMSAVSSASPDGTDKRPE